MQLEGTVHDQDVLCLLKLHCAAAMELDTELRGASFVLSSLLSSVMLWMFFVFPAFDSTLPCHHIARLAMRLTSKHQLIYEI